jgi:type II secretory pathway component PulM
MALARGARIVTVRLSAPWRARTARERRLLGAVGFALAIGAAALAGEAVRRDTVALRTRVARAERRLTAARALAGRLDRAERDGPADAGASLVSRVESAITDTVGAERLARIEPGAEHDDAATARLVGVELADVVRVLGALENPPRGLLVRDLDLRRHPDEPARYDAALVVTHGRVP